ncbi:hypothetical protein ACE38W_17530 [Chitinophaga sp. Hz27]|uniref:hypothetical protein n=1 Tax=Chitinophaga sp. Hz27 TaxID=3347169 RepID=UPI0035D92B35
MTNNQLSQLMLFSWEIQRSRQVTRSKALANAWAILLNANLTVWYLKKKYSHTSYPNRDNNLQLTLLAD